MAFWRILDEVTKAATKETGSTTAMDRVVRYQMDGYWETVPERSPMPELYWDARVVDEGTGTDASAKGNLNRWNSLGDALINLFTALNSSGSLGYAMTSQDIEDFGKCAREELKSGIDPPLGSEILRRLNTTSETEKNAKDASTTDASKLHEPKEPLKAGSNDSNPSAALDTDVMHAVSPDDVPALLELLKELAGRWQLFLGQLIPKWKVDAIQLGRAGYPDAPTLCLSDGLHYWVMSGHCPRFENILAVLRGQVVSNVSLAERIENYFKEKYCKK